MSAACRVPRPCSTCSDQTEAGEEVDRGAFQAEVLDGLREAVREQAAAGIDIAGDGELPRIGFSFYAKDRMTGFGGVAQRGTVTDFAKFPGYAELVVSRSAGQSTAGKSASVWQTPECVDEVRYDPELTQATEELDLFADALAAEPGSERRFHGDLRHRRHARDPRDDAAAQSGQPGVCAGRGLRLRPGPGTPAGVRVHRLPRTHPAARCPGPGPRAPDPVRRPVARRVPGAHGSARGGVERGA